MQSLSSTIISQLLIASFHFLVYSYINARGSYALVALPEGVTAPALLVFGDSTVDPGNNDQLLTLCRCDFPPYGKDFEGGKATGRFSNGKVASDFAAEEIGIKELVPAYYDPTLTIDDLLTGVSFAFGCSGFDPVTAETMLVPNLTVQLQLFDEYKQRLSAAVGEEKTSDIVSQSIYLVATGTNDFTSTYFVFPFRRAFYNITAYIELLINYASSFLESLYEEGARRIGVQNIPPMGCLPSQRTLFGGLMRDCVVEYNEVALLFNSKLLSLINSLNSKFTDAYFVYLDLYTPLLNLINNPQIGGFSIANKGCCGTGELEVSYLCNRFDTTCKNDSSYIFWDTFHATQAAYQFLIKEILSKSINGFFQKNSSNYT